MAKKIDIQDYLSSLDDVDIIYRPNPGNAGDSAIALATYQILERSERPYRAVTGEETLDVRDKILMYGGGGNLGTPHYHEARHFIQRYHSRAKRFVILPHTIRGHADLLRSLGKNVDVFCRERYSYEWVCQHASRARVFLSDDLAFRLDVEAVLTEHGQSRRMLMSRLAKGVWNSISQRVLGRDGKRDAVRVNGRLGTVGMYQLVKETVLGPCLLPALRTDMEGTSQEKPAGNVDVSQLFEYGVMPKALAQTATALTLSYLDQFQAVITNRLHIGILGGLLGKQIEFYPNSYFKNRAVYEFSMHDQFPNVHWHGD